MRVLDKNTYLKIIMATVSRIEGYTIEEIKDDYRGKDIIKCRQFFCYYAYNNSTKYNLKITYQDLANFLGKDTHATILSAVKKAKRFIDTEPTYFSAYFRVYHECEKGLERYSNLSDTVEVIIKDIIYYVNITINIEIEDFEINHIFYKNIDILPVIVGHVDLLVDITKEVENKVFSGVY